jgi:hypothetical protein
MSLKNGADGFMFSASETTLSILREAGRSANSEFRLYAIIPYAYEYVRMATQFGGISGLARQVAKRIIMSGDLKALVFGLKGLALMDLESLLKAYVSYEISRVKSAAGKNAHLRSVLLHEIITEMALALNTPWIFRSFIDFTLKRGITPGFETRNFPFLMKRLVEWSLDCSQVIIATPFNKASFQMNPSRIECERALANAPESNVISMSILAAGYLRLPEAIDYIRSMSNLKGTVLGVSNESQARESFNLLRASFK